MLDVLGEYKVLELLGEGGMGKVYHGYQESLDREVALKVLSENLTRNETFVARFQREARAAASLVHPNVIQIYSIGCEEGVHYFAMEFIRGRDLSQRLGAGESVSLVESAEIMIQVAQALCGAAEVGLVHRDIKPSNIMLTEKGMVKITDFGLAKTTDNDLTDAGTIVGTANYMSPEQGMGKPLDFRSDIYSLGVVFYELATGQPPFQAEQPAAVLYKHVYEQPMAPAKLNADLPEGADSIILKMLAKNPEDRPASPEELLAELHSLHAQLTGAEVMRPGGTFTGAASSVAAPPASGPRPSGPDTEAPTLVSGPLQQTRTALVADDVESVRRLLRTILEEKQFSVLEAEDGEAAVAQAVEAKPDLILLDVGLPKVDGLTVLQRLAEAGLQSQVIVISGYKDRETILRASKFQINAYLAKPVNIHELRKRLDQVLGGGAEKEGVQAHGEAARPVAPGEGEPRFVLIFDRQPYSQFLFRQVLEAYYHRVACTGEESEIREALAEELPDLLIVSVRRDDEGAMELLRLVRERGWSLPVISVVDGRDRRLQEEVRSLELGPVLPKPVHLDDLSEQVRAALDGSRQAAREVMRSQVFSGLLRRQMIKDNAFTVFDFARSLLPAVPPGQREEFEQSIMEKPARAVCNLIGGVLKRVADQQGVETAMGSVRYAYRRGNFETRNLCLALLRELVDPATEAAILPKVLADEDYRMRIRVLHRMGEMGRPRFAELAVRFLNDDVFKVRTAAEECLEMLGLQASLVPIVSYFARARMKLPDRLRRLVVDARGPEGVEILEAYLDRASPEEREYIAWLLGEMHSRQPAVPLLSLLKDKHAAVRAAAARSLGRVPNPTTQRGLLHALADPNAAVQKAVIRALANHNLTPAAHRLVEILGARGKRIGPAALEVVTRLNQSPSALERMLDGIDRLDADVRKVLSLFLSRLFPRQERLQEIVQNLNAQDRDRRRTATREILDAVKA
jgi:DNA-binding response OmpR family regulator/HEAT repeat protein/predicted Ser/Thr protein kinase